jgi:hypothetical protein
MYDNLSCFYDMDKSTNHCVNNACYYSYFACRANGGRSGVLIFEIEFWISKSSFEFRSGVLNFEIKFWISKSTFEFRSRLLNFEIEFWISKSSFEFRSRVLNFEWAFWAFVVYRCPKLDNLKWITPERLSSMCVRLKSILSIRHS